MLHKLYLLSMIVLPLFCGSIATGELISYLSVNYNGSIDNVWWWVLMALCGMSAGIRYAWSAIKAAEDKKED